MAYTKYEQETYFNYNNGEITAEIYTYDRKLIRRLLELSNKQPDECYQSKEIRDGAYTFTIPKVWVRVNPPRKISNEQIKKQTEALRKARENKYNEKIT